MSLAAALIARHSIIEIGPHIALSLGDYKPDVCMSATV